MTFEEILKIKGFNPKEFRLVRHGYKEINPLETFKNDRPSFDAYQAFQEKGKFAKAKYIASFAPHHGTQALFLGVWRIDDEIIPSCDAPATQRELITKFNWTLNGSFYHLIEQDIFEELSNRLIIDWGGSTISWVQIKTDKLVIAIFPPNHVTEFKSYEDTLLTHPELVLLNTDETSNYTWHNALRSVNGIYCITDMSNSRNYVGSAYGKDGIWGRWVKYATNYHGDNKMLVELLRENPKAVEYFQFSILEILSATCTEKDAIAKEGLWKKKLGSRNGGYNLN